MENIKEKLVFVCLAEEFGTKLSKMFADSLAMHFADCKELIEYDLFSSRDVLSQCGEEYYKAREKKVIEMTCRYENSVMFAGYDIFLHNKSVFDKYSTKIYLKVPKKALSKGDVINKLAYDYHDLELQNACDVTVNIKSLSEKSALGEIYKVLGGLK